MSATNSHLKQTVVRILDSQPEIQQAILFGSVAAGKERTESDIDLAVDGGRVLTAEEKITLIASLAEATGRSTDLVDLHSVGVPLLGQILSHGERILESDTRYANLVRKHLFDKSDFLPYRERILRERRQAWIGK